jgi:hypothetical protein
MILQPDWGIWCPPVPGAVVLVGQGIGDEAFIIRVHPVRYGSQVTRNQMRRLLPGEKLFQSSGGSEIYMTSKGDVRISDAFGQVWELVRDDLRSRFKSDTIDWVTSGGSLRIGSVRRKIPGARSSTSVTRSITQDGRSVESGGVVLGEVHLKVVETEDKASGDVDDITDPIIEVTLGTKVDSSGSKSSSQDGEEICLEISTRAGAQCTIQVDKGGNMTLAVGGTLRFTCSDVRIGTSTMRSLVDERFVSSFNSHVHAGAGTPPTTPVVAATVATSHVKGS